MAAKAPSDPGLPSSWKGTLVLGLILTVAEISLGFAAAKGNTKADPYEPLIGCPIWCGVAGLILPVLFFEGVAGTSSAWDWLGELRKHEVSSSEPEQKGFLFRPWNAHTSNVFIAAGFYVLASCSRVDTRAPIASAYFGCCLVALGLASYAWWGSRRQVAWWADNVMMEVTLWSIPVLIVCICIPGFELCFVSCAVAYGILRAKLLRVGADLLPPSIVLLLTAPAAMRAHGNTGATLQFVLACNFSLCGLAAKIADVSAGWKYGTALFHYLEAMGFSAFFLWAQTLPRNEGHLNAIGSLL